MSKHIHPEAMSGYNDYNWKKEGKHGGGPADASVQAGDSLTPKQLRDKERRDAKDRRRRFSGCFVATVVYGGADTPQVTSLRAYRDEVLLRTRSGRTFVALYYRIGPYLAELVSKHPLLMRLTRKTLDSLVVSIQRRG